MKCLKFVTIVFLLSGCAARTWQESYQVQPGVYYVSVSGNGYTSKKAVITTFHARSAAICGGEDRYDMVSQSDTSKTDSYTMKSQNPYQRDTEIEFNKPGVEGYVRCK